MDMHGYYDLSIEAAGSCFNVTPLTENMTAVNNCANKHSQLCCLDYTFTDTATVVGFSFPKKCSE